MSECQHDKAHDQAQRIEGDAKALVHATDNNTVADGVHRAFIKDAGMLAQDHSSTRSEVDKLINEYDKTAAKEHLPSISITGAGGEPGVVQIDAGTGDNNWLHGSKQAGGLSDGTGMYTGNSDGKDPKLSSSPDHGPRRFGWEGSAPSTTEQPADTVIKTNGPVRRF